MSEDVRQLERRGRRALAWAATWFLVLQIGLACAIERWLPYLRDPEYAVRAALLERRLERMPQKPCSVVMLGSSRTTRGLDGGVIEPGLQKSLHEPVVVFNMGCTGAGPLTELLHFRRLLNYGVRPDLLLIEVLPPLLSRRACGREFEHLPLHRAWLSDLVTLERYRGDDSATLHEAWCLEWLLPWYSHRYAITSKVSPDFVPYRARIDWAFAVDNSGWSGAPVKRLPRNLEIEAIEKARQEYLPCLEGFEVDSLADLALHEILDQCRKDGILAALVLMPEGSEFRAIYSRAVWQQVDHFIQDIAATYEISVINARNWIADEDFSDSHHLLRHGAVAFTERLGKEAILPLLRERASRPIDTSPNLSIRITGGPK